MRSAFLIVWFTLLGASIPVRAAEVFFEEPFDASANSPNLDGEGNYKLSPSGGIVRIASNNTSDRRYVRTIMSNYLSRDFRYEVTYTTDDQEIVFIGIGSGDSEGSEPRDSVNFRLHSPDLVEGKVEVTTVSGIIGFQNSYGPHRARIEKIGNTVTFAVDLDYDGTFAADFSNTILDVRQNAPFLTSQNSRLFFGCSALLTRFDDVIIQPIEGSAPCVPSDPDLVGWWPGQGDAADLLGGNDGLVVGSGFVAAKVGTGFALDASSYVEILDAPALCLSSESPSTLDSWVYPTALPPETDVPLTATKPSYYGLLYNTTGHSLRAHVHDGTRWISFDAAFNLPLNAWTHVAQTWDGSNLSIYANGKLVGSGRTDGDPSERQETSAFIGRWLKTEAEPQDLRFTGTIDEVGIYNAALDLSKILALFLAGAKGRCVPPPPPYSVSITQEGRRCVTLVLKNEAPIKGGEIGIAYDPDLVTVATVKPGADFPTGGDLHSRLKAQNSCLEEQGIKSGLTLAWLNPVTGETVTPPGTHQLLKICFNLAQDQLPGTCSPLEFVKCLGIPEAPVKNIVTTSTGTSVSLSAKDGRVCIQEELSFIRGDVNADGNFDISDPIIIMGCLFLGDPCPRCTDATDANDDGLVDLSDPIHLLNWRFIDGPAPGAPFPTCGRDPLVDTLDDCESFSLCP